MNPLEPATGAILELKNMELWLRANDEYRERLNNALFSVANAMGVHPHDLAYYILLRTSKL